MGKLILCSGQRTQKPYVFTAAQSRIYSIEELCYYFYNNIYFIDNTIFSDSLIDWIRTELGLSERAGKLKLLKSSRADLKTMVTVIMCSADYYSEQEIKQLLKTVDELSTMSQAKKNSIRADIYLEKKQFAEAAGEYERILASEQASGLSPEEYGDILHNLAVAKVHMKGLNDAVEIFRQAYERNRKEESLKEYLYSLVLCNQMELFRQKTEEYNVNSSLSEEIIDTVRVLNDEAQTCEEMGKINELRKCREEGRINEYSNRADSVIGAWISTIRQL